MRLKAMVLEVMLRHTTGRSTFAIASLPHPPIFSCYGGDIHTLVKNHNDRLLKLTELVVEHNRTTSQDPFDKKGTTIPQIRGENAVLEDWRIWTTKNPKPPPILAVEGGRTRQAAALEQRQEREDGTGLHPLLRRHIRRLHMPKRFLPVLIQSPRSAKFHMGVAPYEMYV